ncbi:MAG: virulence protein RhuM/Fic/DOC family protein [Parcubacteria group bacterium]|nr:virulence protein RhuM/Fic/DOC family protein [Parcubacteria group bacterium]
MDNQQEKNNKIVIYNTADGQIKIDVNLKNETVWLSQKQMAEIFDCSVDNVTLHLKNIYLERELDEDSTTEESSVVQQEGGRTVKRQIKIYNLDAIIALGYRVNSQRATQFRVWATKILKDYLLQGYAVNEKRLLEVKSKFNQLKETINFLQKKSKTKLLKGQSEEILNLLSDYSKTLSLLEKYDKKKLKSEKGIKARFVLEYENCLEIISELKKNLMEKKQAGGIFGNEIDKKFESAVKSLYQTFDGKELYKTIEDKASHLLYLTIKDHPFIDGNKRIGSFLFVYFLDKNDYLYRKGGEKKINDNALTALALLTAQSDSREKEQMIALIMQLLK